LAGAAPDAERGLALREAIEVGRAETNVVALSADAAPVRVTFLPIFAIVVVAARCRRAVAVAAEEIAWRATQER
jgi:hypothetical protein